MKVPILVYHRVTDSPHPALAYYAVRPAAFRRQMRVLRMLGWKTIGLDEVVAAVQGGSRIPSRSFVVTFDDAYDELERDAVPVLEANGQTAIIYACAGLLGSEADSLRAPGDPIHEDARLLDEEGLRRISGRGFDIGSHGMSHPRLTELDAAALAAEVRGSRRRLEAVLDGEVRHFAYPSGDYDDRVVEAVGAAGYLSAVTTDPGARIGSAFEMPRIYVGRDDGWARVALRIEREARWSG